MSASLYPKLAWDGIRKNKRLYIPYILTGAVMVMIYYILAILANSSVLTKMRGAATLLEIMPMAAFVIAAFSLIFLFYTNSFLIRQRKSEFGLYNILGMDKRNISRIMFWDSVIVCALSIGVGLFLGIALSKLTELGLLNLLHLDVSYELSIGLGGLAKTAIVFSLIYLLLLARSLFAVYRSKPLELLSSSKVGEKAPKGNLLLALIGTIILSYAYYLALSVEEPLSALGRFMIAVILVIVATYLLFIAGSVVICRLLQKNKRYYYKPNHFVSISSMVYRMKRNGAGLASICILLTMVLVMISATVTLYFSAEETISSSFPYSLNISVAVNEISEVGELSDERITAYRAAVTNAVGEYDEMIDYRIAEVSGMFTEDGILIDVSRFEDFTFDSYEDVGSIHVIALDDYNRIMGTNETLSDDECMIYRVRTDRKFDSFAVENGKTYKVKKVLDAFFEDRSANTAVNPSVFIVVNDFDAFTEPILPMLDYRGIQMMQLRWRCGVKLDADREIGLAEIVSEAFYDIELDEGLYSYSVASREANRDDFYSSFGGLFFLGIMLSAVFLFAAVLIIYYKQITEGYEDASRFEIMQRVGMTARDIKRSINSQMLTVFFLPLGLAGVHLAFAFPILWKMLEMFNLTNMPFAIMVTVICFVIFALFYALVYKITSNVYYGIVSGTKR